jgi:hypothetical protein
MREGGARNIASGCPDFWEATRNPESTMRSGNPLMTRVFHVSGGGFRWTPDGVHPESGVHFGIQTDSFQSLRTRLS